MFYSRKPLLTAVLLGALISAACADGVPEEYAFLQEQFPGLPITAVEPSPVEGMLQVSMGADVFYISKDGKYGFQGDLVDLQTGANLSEQARVGARGAYLSGLGDDAGVMFRAAEEKYVVTVFTDIDCPYCRKLHNEMAEYNERGISVRYMFFPRHGEGSPGWNKADAVWCSDSRQQAMTAAKSGENLAVEVCEGSPVGQHYQLGKDMGVTGTPAIFTEEGDLIVGYRSATDLLTTLEELAET